MQAWLLALMAAPAVLAGCAADAAPTTLGVQQWHDQLRSTPDAFLLDVRTPQEYAEGHIANATLVPLQSLEDAHDALPEDHATPIFVYCRSGHRSAQAADILARHGYTDVRDLDGGFTDWKQAGYPVEA